MLSDENLFIRTFLLEPLIEQIVRPDFIFFAEQDSKVVVDIVDPHGFHLADALPKLQGLAHYAEAHSHAFRRIEAVVELNGKLRVLDLTRTQVR